MAKKTGVVFENDDFRVTVVRGGVRPANLLITEKATGGVAKLIPDSDGLAILAQEGSMAVMSGRVRPEVKIAGQGKPR